MFNTRNRTLLVSLTAVLALGAAACGDDGEDPAITGDTAPTTTEAETDDDMMEGDDETAMADGPTGPACAAIPEDGEGSAEEMAELPAASAASTNPELTTLVDAVTAADLVDTLNGDGPFTIFAPVNDAFAEIPEEDLEALLADQEQLTSVLTYHVVADELDAAAVSEEDTLETVNGEELSVMTMGSEVNVGDATVVCANIEVANGVVHLIDTVLMP
jgi:uncharacterized surface protein with fasciclin (FAS1) repeats